MADTTDIYGIRFPQDGDSIDTAGDIQQLAETSEVALAGLNWDTATAEQKAAVAEAKEVAAEQQKALDQARAELAAAKAQAAAQSAPLPLSLATRASQSATTSA